MASKQLFKSSRVAAAATTNLAGGRAHAMAPAHALAQYATTGCFGATYYASAEMQLYDVLELCAKVSPEVVARTAVYARKHGFMKDMPALLCAWLAAHGRTYLPDVFAAVIDDARMLRNFVQIVRSGVTGRRSLGTLPKRLVAQWFESRDDEAVFRASVGNDPSLADVIKMVHPRPATASRRALYAWILGKAHERADLPKIVRDYEDFRARRGEGAVPEVPFLMLTSLDLSTSAWCAIARTAGWQALRMNLNTFERHGVFEVPGMADVVASRLRHVGAIRHAKAFPYQLMTAYVAADAGVPMVVREALQDAMEIAIENVPSIAGKVYVCTDVSGSMQSAATGQHHGATSVVRCIDVAALMSAAVLRNNPGAEVLPFGTKVEKVALNPRDTVMTNAQRLAGLNGGGTDCSAPLAHLNARRATGDLVVMVSDNESWMGRGRHGGTAMMDEWETFRERNPKARLVCIDVTPNRTVQAYDRSDILNVGGFSDAVFDLVATFATMGGRGNHMAEVIARTSVD
jgi:60 kDa SS-A/Ro ribonucleoprotein